MKNLKGLLSFPQFMNAMMALVVVLATFGISNTARAKQLDLVKQGSYAISSSLLQSILAKEMCSCVFVSVVGGPNTPVQTRADKCLQRSQLPLSPSLIGKLLNEQIDPRTSSIQVTPKLLGAVLGLFQGKTALAIYEGEKHGCRLLTDEELRARR